MTRKIKLLAAILLFAGGWIIGSNNNTAPVITSSMGGASYAGGYQPDQQAAAMQSEGAVALRTEQGRCILLRMATRFRLPWKQPSLATPFR